MASRYKINPIVWMLRDEASVKFHVKNNDYFGTIAAILSLIKQEIKKDGAASSPVFDEIFQNLEADLMLLQKNYHINPNSKNRKRTPKGKLISQ